MSCARNIVRVEPKKYTLIFARFCKSFRYNFAPVDGSVMLYSLKSSLNDCSIKYNVISTPAISLNQCGVDLF